MLDCESERAGRRVLIVEVVLGQCGNRVDTVSSEWVAGDRGGQDVHVSARVTSFSAVAARGEDAASVARVGHLLRAKLDRLGDRCRFR